VKIMIRVKKDSEGTHCGFDWITIVTHMGYRNGYIKIPVGHPWHLVGYDEIGADVHGGLTFSEVVRDNENFSDGYWIGFDCAHSQDAPDLSAIPDKEETDIEQVLMLNMGGHVRSREYVENECLHLCEQARNAK
jgi:hypothetical protein